MTNSLRLRIFNFAKLNRERPMWKRRLFALVYGAELPALSRIKEGPTQ